MTIDRGAALRDLHRPGAPFVLANAWDMGSAKVLAALGAEAIGTTSNGHAFTLGRPDMGRISRDEALAHAQDLVAATALPVSGDLEDGYGAAPETVAETVRLAAEAGLAGCSIEDTIFTELGAYEFDLAVDRIRAASAAARALPGDFVLVARADGMMNGVYDLHEALRRLRAFDAAGADCLYAPLPPDMDALRQICQATRKPVNALAVGRFAGVTCQAFADLGVARISLGSGLARVAQGALITAARAMLETGDFSAIRQAAKGSEVQALLEQATVPDP